MKKPDESNEIQEISKSQRKRDSLEVQDLGKKMIQLNPQILKKLPLSETIIHELIAAKSMRQGALKRQIQYIGKLLRTEEDLNPLRQALTIYFK